MPEEGIETQELKEKLEEAAEHAHGHGHGGEHGGGDAKNAWIMQLSLSTAIIAVLAAIAALQSGSYANDAMLKKNEAILAQSKASDQWAFYQAKGIKAAVYQVQANAGSADAVKREKEEQEAIKKNAEDLEKKAELADTESEHLLHTHHEYAKSVTIFQVAIALAAIAALTKRKPMWLVSMATGLFGVFFFVRGLGLFGH
jgi:hypothetical protein